MDTLPSFIAPYNCTNWELIPIQHPIDTVYFKLNSNHYNIFVNFYQESNSTWTLFDDKLLFTYPNCSGGFFNGRFPVITNFDFSEGPFVIKKLSSQEFILTYKMASAGFKFIFPGKKIKLKIKIQDHALHKSNEIETSEVQL